MSGPFVQRGEPAFLSKYQRAKAALTEGVDLLLELPVCYATASANYFALGAVSLLHNLGVVTHLSFGVETQDLELFYALVHFLKNEGVEYKEQLKQGLKQGLSFPKARRMAVSKLLGEEYGVLLDTPNNILALEYLLALNQLKSNILPVPIKRITNQYHQKELTKTISSATAIRNAAINQLDEPLFHALPSAMKETFIENYHKNFPVDLNDFSTCFHYQNVMSPYTINDIFDGSLDFEHRFMKRYSPSLSLTELTDVLSYKGYTTTRIQRILLHFLLGIQKSQMKLFLENNIVYYGKILGFRTSASPLLKEIKNHASIPVFYRPIEEEGLSDIGTQMYQMDKKSEELYRLVVSQKFHTPLLKEKTIILPTE